MRGVNGAPGPEISGNSEDAMLLRVDAEQHLVVDAEQRWQPLQRQLEQWQRQWEQRYEQQLRRHDIHPSTVGVDVRLHRHMKYGKTRTYWSEYIFYGYVKYEPGLILITGFPDQPQTQPLHDKYRSSGQKKAP